MSKDNDGTKAPDPTIDPKLPRVILTYTDKGTMIELKSTNWGMALSMLVDALPVVRIEEIKERARKKKEEIVTGDPSQIPNLRA